MYAKPLCIPSSLLLICSLTLLSLMLITAFLTSPINASVAQLPTSEWCQPGQYGPYEDIGTVFCAYGGYSTTNPLGRPISAEWSWPDQTPIGFGKIRNKYQNFEHGTIYNNVDKRTAFAVFNDVNTAYKKGLEQYGLPISSEIGNAANRTCLALFEKGYIRCLSNGTLGNGFWSTMTADQINQQLYLPEFRMPFTGTAQYTGGPHQLGNRNTAATVTAAGSGIDIAGVMGFIVAMAPGTVIDVVGAKEDCTKKDSGTGFGCWVTMRNDFSGTVVLYGHIQPLASLQKGYWIKQGMPIGYLPKDKIGDSSGPHLHVELGMGIQPAIYGDQGRPLDWHGTILDGYLITRLFTGETAGSTYNYDGTAVRLSFPYLLNSHTHYRQTDLVTGLSDAAYKFVRFSFRDLLSNGTTNPKQAWGWMTTGAWNVCQTPAPLGYGMFCGDGKAYQNTTFSEGGALSASTVLAGVQSSQATPRAAIESSNQYLPLDPIYGPPYPNAPSATPTPPLGSNCPTDGRGGVYFYIDQNYRGTCHYSVSNISSFGNTAVGDNALSSVKVIGNWKVKLFEDVNYGGRYDLVYGDVSNLDTHSLGDQYSSAQITNQDQTCPTDGRAGVYMYSDRNYSGRCLYATADVLYFGDTILGNDTLSSIRFIGDWEAKVYEDPNLQGRYDVIGSDDPNLDVRSLGDQYSSVKIRSVIVVPTPTLTPSPTAAPSSVTLLSPSVNNGGFEQGNLSGWYSQGGSWLIDRENPHGGVYHVRGTNATEASLYRSFDLAPYRNQIESGVASAIFNTWIDIGKSENYRFVVRFVNSAGSDLWRFDTGWRYHAGSYAEVGGSLPTVPANSTQVLVEVSAKRSSGDFTDADVDDFSLILQFAPIPVPTATPTLTPSPTSTTIPDCGRYTSDRVVMFDSAFCNPTDGQLASAVTNALYNLADADWQNRISSIYIPSGWSMYVFDLDNGRSAERCLTATTWDLSLEQYSGVATGMNNSISSLVIFDKPTCPSLSTGQRLYLPIVLRR